MNINVSEEINSQVIATKMHHANKHVIRYGAASASADSVINDLRNMQFLRRLEMQSKTQPGMVMVKDGQWVVGESIRSTPGKSEKQYDALEYDDVQSDHTLAALVNKVVASLLWGMGLEPKVMLCKGIPCKGYGTYGLNGQWEFPVCD